MTVRGSCLCGDVAWETTGEFDFMSHCHCSRCRKANGAAFSTEVMCDAADFRFTRGRDRVSRFESSPGLARAFCQRCGSPVPEDTKPWQGKLLLPAGSFDDEIDAHPMGHIFAGSKAPWYDIPPGLPTWKAYPPGVDVPVLPDFAPRAPDTGKPQGSCLCGGVTFVVEGEPLRVQNCHCQRCRKARGTAHASNLFTTASGVRITSGEDLIDSYKVPEARYYTNVFCRRCGSKLPRFDPDRNIALVPMGTLDGDPGVRPERHIFVDSKASWFDIKDDLPQFPGPPPA
jgi:hypothetical protein